MEDLFLKVYLYLATTISVMSLFDIISQIVILTFGVTALFLSQLDNKSARKAAPIIGLSAEPFWLYTSFTASQWGVFCLGFVYIFVWSYTFYKVWIKKPTSTVI